MDNKTLKSLTHAHAWIGLIVSIILFVVFFAGSISLFKNNIIAWEKLPLHTDAAIASEYTSVNYDKAIETISKQYDVYVDHRFYLYPPTESLPFIEAYFAKNIDGIDPITGEDHTDVHIMLNAQTGEIVGDASQFNYGNIVYMLHYNLGLGRIGLYLVGIITLFFFVAVLSGLVIHWRKLFKNFFQYRKDGSKDKWLDAHNVIGTMGLPFHVMYAFTGLVFNLVIVYQISYALVLYQGDQTKLLAAAGYSEPHIDITDIKHPVSGVNALAEIASKDMGGIPVDRIQIEHFGDQSAVAIFQSDRDDHFATSAEVHYKLDDQTQIYITQDNHNNAVRSGLSVIARLHFGDFAGYGLRVVFFLLGLATCYVILTGNLMWIEKRAKQRNQSQRALNIVRRMTGGGFTGFILATAVGFVLARAIPMDLATRMQIIENSLYVVFLVILIVAQFISAQAKFSQYLLSLSGGLFALPILLDWTLLAGDFSQLVIHGNVDFIITELMLATLSVICFFSANQVKKKRRNTVTADTPEHTNFTPVAE